MAKKPSKIFRDFWQLSTLIANISETDPQIENRKNSWSTTTPPTLDDEKTVNFGPQRKKLLTCILTNPSGHFSGDYISALMGCYGLKFLHALEIDQGYLAHTSTGTGSPWKKFNRENLKFGLKFSVYTSITSWLMGISSQIFIQTTCGEPWVYTLFGRLAPCDLGGPKNRPKFGGIYDNLRLWSRISPKRIHKSKIGKVVDQLQPLPRWMKKDRELWSTNEKVIDVHIDPAKWTFFSRLYFCP